MRVTRVFRASLAVSALAAASVMLTGHAFAEPAPPSSSQAAPPSERRIIPLPLGAPVLMAPPWMGVMMDNGGDIGVRIERVVRGSPAERAGVRTGDRIVAVDGARVTAPGQVSRAVGARKIGDTVNLSIERTGQGISASVILAARPSGDDVLRMDLVGAPAPAWTNVTPLSGAPSSLAQLKGKVVLVDFWASWCGPCKMIAPRISALRDRYGAQGLAVVGITTDEVEKAAVYAEKNQMRYPVVVDKDGDTSRAWGITGLPTVVLIDKKGVVRELFVGFDPSGESRVESLIKSLLAESATTGTAPPSSPSSTPHSSAPPSAPSPPAPPSSPLRPVPTPSVPRPDSR